MTEFLMHIKVFGLRIPTGVTFVVDHDFVFQAIGPSENPDIHALFRVIEGSDAAYRACLLRLQKFADCYTFESRRAVRIGSGYGYSQIAVGADLRLGFHGELSMDVLITPEQAKKQLDNAANLSKLSLPKHLQIALTFYARSSDTENYDEILIDMITALESMFSSEIQELRYRLSLRAAYFFCPDEKERRKEIFDLIYEMYKLRSKVLHGESVSFGKSEIDRILQLHGKVRDAISRLISLRDSVPTKNALIDLIDSRVIHG